MGKVGYEWISIFSFPLSLLSLSLEISPFEPQNETSPLFSAVFEIRKNGG